MRVQVLSGDFTCSGVIGSNGKWLREPYVIASSLPFFQKYNAQELLAILQNSGLAIPNTNIFSNPTSHIEQISLTFYSGYQRRQLAGTHVTFPIKYCLKCIESDIECLGFGYFYADWLKLNHCVLHGAALMELNAPTRKKSIVAITNILRGVQSEYSDKASNDNNQLYAPQYEDMQRANIAPCLKLKLISWLRKTCTYLDKDTILKDRLAPRLKYMNGVYQDLNDDHLTEIHNTLLKVHPKAYRGFYRKYSIEKQVEVKVKFDTFTYKILATDTHNCSKCVLHFQGLECPLTNGIQAKDTYHKKVISIIENPCDYYLQNSRHYWEDRPSWYRKRIEENMEIALVNLYKHDS